MGGVHRLGYAGVENIQYYLGSPSTVRLIAPYSSFCGPEAGFLIDSAILTILQIESAANDPLTRNFAFFSLICALISLLFGCMYIIRFGTMRKTYKAAEWALVSYLG